MYEATRQPAVK